MTAEMGASGRARLVEWGDPAASAEAAQTMTGLEFLRAVIDGSLPQAPMVSVLRTALVEASFGSVTFETQLDESFFNPIGLVHGGLVCTLLDSAMGSAVQSTLPAGTLFTSIDINVQYLRPVSLDGGPLRTTGIVDKGGRRVAFARATVSDRDGKSIATATSSLLIVGPEGRS